MKIIFSTLALTFSGWLSTSAGFAEKSELTHFDYFQSFDWSLSPFFEEADKRPPLTLPSWLAQPPEKIGNWELVLPAKIGIWREPLMSELYKWIEFHFRRSGFMPPKGYYLIRAAVWEYFAKSQKCSQNKLDCRTVSINFVPGSEKALREEWRDALELYQDYDRRAKLGGVASNSERDLQRQLDLLQRLVAAGYRGELLPDVEKLRSQLEAKLKK